MTPVPRWKDEDKVRLFINWLHADINRHITTLLQAMPDDELMQRVEENAIERGDVDILCQWARDGYQLSPRAVRLIAAPQKRRKVGSPKKPLRQRLGASPLHRYAYEMEVIQGLLKIYYPNESGHRDRAKSITIRNHRPKLTASVSRKLFEVVTPTIATI